MFKRILAPLDGSTLAAHALQHLAALAKLNDAEIHLLRVLERGTSFAGVIDPIDWHLQKAEAQTYLQEVSERLQDITSLGSQTEVLEGPAAASIVDYADQQSVDLIVLSSHGQGGISAWNTSGIAQKVIQRAGRSIMLSRPYSEMGYEHATVDAAHYHRILVPLDGSQRAETVLPLAAAIAQQHSAELVLVHVVLQPEILERTPRTSEDEKLLNQILERNHSAAIKYFDQLRARLSPEPQTHVLIDPDIATSLHEFVAQNEIDLVVTTAHGQSGRNRWPYGAMTTTFIMYGTTPLLILQDAAKQETERTSMERNNVTVDPQDKIKTYAHSLPTLTP